jgi:arylsulfatase A-like enzyme
MTATPSGHGYWMVASDGGIFSFGDAAFHGSTGAIKLNKPIVGMTATPSGHGYWMVASDGGIFSFGDAAFHGSTGGLVLRQPIVGMASTRSGNGYWLVAADGGVLAYGDAGYFGAATGKAGGHPVVAMTTTPTGLGYWEVTDDGQSFGFGDAGATTSVHTENPVVGAAALPADVAPGLVSGTGGDPLTNPQSPTPGSAPTSSTSATSSSTATSSTTVTSTTPTTAKATTTTTRKTTTTTAGGTTAPAGAPNVLFVLTDDQRYDTMQFMPKTRKWLEDGGTQFTNAFATTPICAPMRTSIMSGRYQHNTGIMNNQTGPSMDFSASLQKYLHDGGYQTGLDGKFLVNWHYGTTPQDFDHYAGVAGGYTDTKWTVDGHSVAAGSQYVTDFQSDRAIDFIDDFHQNPDKPWYLELTPQAPHNPMTPADQYANAPLPPWEPSPAVGNEATKPDFIRNQHDTYAAGEAARNAQARTLMSVDDMMDRIFQHLSDTGQLDNTMVIYTGDSGWLYDEYGIKSKTVPYLPSVHVPFDVRWPGHLPEGAIDPRQMELLDVAPSILAASGLQPDLKYPMDGHSFLAPTTRTENLLEYHYSPDFTSTPSWSSIRTATYDYIEWYGYQDDMTLKTREYYDLTADPWEVNNLLDPSNAARAPSPATLDDLASRLAKDKTCQGTTGPSACP